MAKLRSWKLKNDNQHKQYKTALGSTDYDIPMFGYRSALLILIITFGSLLLIPAVCNMIGINYRLPTVILCAICSGFSVAYSQFFIERKIGISKGFWVVGGLLSIFIGILIFLVIFSGILM